MRRTFHAAFWGYLFAAVSGTLTASATSLVAKVEKDRIILAADTRENVNSMSGEPKDDFCKIVALGKVGFAATGVVTYSNAGPGDTLSDWSASGDAQSSYSSHPNKLADMADDWGARAKKHYTDFYFASLESMRRVTELAGSNNLNMLVTGLFAGWDDRGQPALIRIDVWLSRPVLSPTIGVLMSRDAIVVTPTVFHGSDLPLPYTTNQITKNLIDDNPDQVRVTAKKWKERFNNFPESERDWRWLAFLIESTNTYDKTVGKHADVLEIRASGHKWLHNCACSAH